MNYYAEVIEILSKEHDWKQIIINIAKKHPKSLVDAFNDLNMVDWKIRARELYFDNGEKIEAIKYCRNITGMSLMEAKDAVESLK